MCTDQNTSTLPHIHPMYKNTHNLYIFYIYIELIHVQKIEHLKNAQACARPHAHTLLILVKTS